MLQEGSFMWYPLSLCFSPMIRLLKERVDPRTSRALGTVEHGTTGQIPLILFSFLLYPIDLLLRHRHLISSYLTSRLVSPCSSGGES